MTKRIGVVLGTRPDAIKMAPVVSELRKHSDQFETLAISTGQHRLILDQSSASKLTLNSISCAITRA
jgi:UDP-N-acetylglucosamine 2-epimerase (non-hydrolysing)